MTLTELRYIVAIARAHNFGRAAEACHVSQPTLSVAVRRLEDELGVMLFERRSNDVVATHIGEQVIAQAQRVLEQTNDIIRIAQQGKDPLCGPLRLGTIYTIGPYLLPQLIPVLRKRAPEIQFLIEENYTVNLSERLKNGELDVIIVALPFEEQGVVTQALYDEPFVVVLPTSHSWNKRKKIKAEQLSQENLLLLGPGNCFRDQVLHICPDCIQSSSVDGGIQKTIEGSSLETIRHMVANDIGITVLPCTAAGVDKYSRRLLSIRPFAEPIPKRRVVLAWRKSFTRPEAIEVLRQAILACPLEGVKILDNSPVR